MSYERRNVERTLMAGCAVMYHQAIVSVTADSDAYAELTERVFERGVRVNRAPEMALALAAPPICPCCYHQCWFEDRPIYPLQHLHVACNCGWRGIAPQYAEWPSRWTCS